MHYDGDIALVLVEAHDRFDRIIERVAEQRIHVGGEHEAERPTVDHASERYLVVRATQTLFGKYRVEHLVIGAHCRIVDGYCALYLFYRLARQALLRAYRTYLMPQIVAF